jgi:hypothetical protein
MNLFWGERKVERRFLVFRYWVLELNCRSIRHPRKGEFLASSRGRSTIVLGISGANLFRGEG